MKTAIIGLPMVGKTSLFTILTGKHEAATKVGLMEARVGVTKVPDPRLEALAEIFQPPKITYATVEYLDCPSISKETLQNASYLGGLRVVDALAHVLRVFEDPSVPHEHGTVDPLRDLNDVETELILSDLLVVEKRMDRLDKDRKKIKNPEFDREFELLERCKATLEENIPLRVLEFSPDDEKRIRGFQFLSQKPMLYVLNLGEEDAAHLHEKEREYREGALAGRARTAVSAICGKVEAELAELPPEDAKEYLASYGLKDSGMQRLINATYDVLGLMSFLTAGDTEVRAWDHTDEEHRAAGGRSNPHRSREESFIRAEVVNWQALVDNKGYSGVRDKGLLRLEGKEYIVKDGDVLVIRHG